MPKDHVECRAVVVEPAVFVFSKPDEAAPLHTQLRLGETVEVLDRTPQGWAQIRLQWGLGVRNPVQSDLGWVRFQTLRLADAEQEAIAYLGRTLDEEGPPGITWLQASALAAHLYGVASRKGQPAACVVPGETWLPGLKLFRGDAVSGSDRNAWWSVLLPDGRSLWVQRGDVVEGGLPPLDAAGSVEEAARMVGRPYVWSGTTSFGYDCSGLTQMLARRRGVGLPHSARRQFEEVFTGFERVGEDRGIEEVGAVARPDEGEASEAWKRLADAAPRRWAETLNVGDFIYFAMGGKRIDHVGVWAGDGEMLHASSGSPPMTKREPLWGGAYAARMTGVRRIV